MKRKTLETVIREMLPADGKFKLNFWTLIRGMEGGWEANDGVALSQEYDLQGVLEFARDRFEIVKANYLPKARVSSIEDIRYEKKIQLTIEGSAFIDIEIL